MSDNELIPLTEPSALTAITKGEVDIQVSTAKQYPRSIQRSIKNAESLATIDRKTAESCFFVLPRGNKVIEGPSVRLAEIMAISWGNLRCDTKKTEEGDKYVTAQATAWDMESNVLIRVEARRRITDKHGKRYNDDMITMTINAAIAIAFRNAVFKIIPRSVVDKIYGGARIVAFGDAATMVQRRAAMLQTFSKLGVTVDRVLARAKRPDVDDIDANDLSMLLGLLNAIRDGATNVDDAFPEIAIDEAIRNSAPKADEVLASMGVGTKKPEPEPEPSAPLSETEPGAKQEPEPPAEEPPPKQESEKPKGGRRRGKNSSINEAELDELRIMGKDSGRAENDEELRVVAENVIQSNLENIGQLTLGEFRDVLANLEGKS